MFGRKGNYSTLEGDSQLQNVSKDHTGIYSRHKVNRRTALFVLAGLCVIIVLIVVLVPVIIVNTVQEKNNNKGLLCPEAVEERVDCYPERGGNVNEGSCHDRGCCWVEGGPDGAPYCFFPSSYGYSVGRVSNTSVGMNVDVYKNDSKLPYPDEVMKLKLEAYYETDTRLRVKISDPKNKRYEVPSDHTVPTEKAKNPIYSFELQGYENGDYFSFSVIRPSTNSVIFSSKTGLVFSDQFIQITTNLTSQYIYGIGEHVGNLSLNINWNTISLFSRDQSPEGNYNVYGVHPFYLCMEGDGNAHGVLLLNSNAMDFFLQPSPALTIRTIGGILDLFFFLGPSPAQVVQQYTELIGRPYFPPYWALGFHLCRWGYESANNTRMVVERMRELEIPQDTQWNDIDYMRDYLDFTVDDQRYAELAELVDELHENRQRYVMIVDPGISSDQPSGSYPPYEGGISRDVFIKNSTGSNLIGKVWPGNVTFPNFIDSSTIEWWRQNIDDFHNQIPFDGLWIDMNEPSDFYDGSINGCPDDPLETPLFIPLHISERGETLRVKTICMTAKQGDYHHYDVHSLYGHYEAIATKLALERVLGTRTLVLSRSTFAGSGQYAGHWLGDNQSKWPDLARSIPGILDFSLFGVPLVGVDICGFSGNTTQELCTRWHQLGAFYPFSRNHNEKNSIAQDPTVWDNQTINITRESLVLRYSLLPYLYTLFYLAHTNGDTVARPLFMQFPKDEKTWTIERQFMWGDGLLISPVLTAGDDTVNAYLPEYERWYDLHRVKEVTKKGDVTLEAPIKIIPLHIRGGVIIPQQEPNITTAASRQNPFLLLVALDNTSMASGQLYLDDGESLGSINSGEYSLITYTANDTSLYSEIMMSGYSPAGSLLIDVVTIMGLDQSPSDVMLNNQPLMKDEWEWHNDTMVFVVLTDIPNINEPFLLQWS